MGDDWEEMVTFAKSGFQSYNYKLGFYVMHADEASLIVVLGLIVFSSLLHRDNKVFVRIGVYEIRN